MRGNSRRASSTGAMPRRTRSAMLTPVERLPVEDHLAAVGTTTPMIAFIVVDLPEALPPSRQTISPASMR